MSSDKTLTQIIHYQKKLEKYAAVGETEKLLCCIHKLKYLPVTVNHLEMTGVGKSINSLRHKNGIIGVKARSLVKKWMMMVEKEEEPEEQISQPDPTDMDTQDNEAEDACYRSDDGDRLQIEEEDQIPSYHPGGYTHTEADNDSENCNGYNPHTSRQDYLSMGAANVPEISYNPSVKDPVADQEQEGSDYSPGIVANGNSSHLQDERLQSPSKEHEKYKRKKHKSSHSGDEKRRSSNNEGLDHKKKKSSKDKGKRKNEKEDKKKSEKESSRDKRKSHSSSKKSTHSSQYKESQVTTCTTSSKPLPTGSTSPNALLHEKKHHSSPKGDSSKEKSRSHSHKDKEKNNNERVKDRKSHKSSKSSKEHKSKKRKIDSDQQAESSSAFGAALMGFDSSPSKKKKKKKDKDRDKERENEKTYESPVKSKPVQLQVDYGRDRLPELPPTAFAENEAAEELPQLLTHYKPLPHVPQRAAKDPFTSRMTDEEALNYMLSSRNNKHRRIYAGKATGLSSVPSLFNCCIRVLQENIDALEATGGIPYDILKPVLERASPQQLFVLEHHNPYFLDDTDELWASHCRKKFRNKQREDMETWRDLFIRSTDEQQMREKHLTEKLNEKYVTKATPQSRTRVVYDNTAIKLPKSVARAQAKYGTVSVPTPVRHQPRPEEAPKPGSSSGGPPRPNRPFPNKPSAGKKPKVAPIMIKARQLMKKVCRK